MHVAGRCLVTIEDGDQQDRALVVAIQNAVSALHSRKRGTPGKMFAEIRITITPNRITHDVQVMDKGFVDVA